MDDTKLERFMSERKPIFVITIPFCGQETWVALGEYIREKGLEKDYYVFILTGNEPKFQMFSDKEIEPIQIEELKELLKL